MNEGYRPAMPPSVVERLRRWHEAAYGEMRQRGAVRSTYLGLDLVIAA